MTQSKQNPSTAKSKYRLVSTKRMGKSEVREKFLPLVASLKDGSEAIEITERNEPVAVLMSYDRFRLLMALTDKETKPAFSLAGSIIELGDIEEGSQEITRDMLAGLERRAANI